MPALDPKREVVRDSDDQQVPMANTVNGRTRANGYVGTSRQTTFPVLIDLVAVQVGNDEVSVVAVRDGDLMRQHDLFALLG